MRYIILGAGGVGGTIGWRLHTHGHDVVLLARGAHLKALRSSGLTVHHPAGQETHRIPVAGGPQDLELTPNDVVIITAKTQQVPAALESLAGRVPEEIAIICGQNGVASERYALRHFENVYGMCVMLPATHLEPGVIRSLGAPKSGILDLGRFPHGVDDLVESVAEDLSSSNFSSTPDPAIMRIKYRKLLRNMHNAVEALAGLSVRGAELTERARAEALEVIEAAGIDIATADEEAERRNGTMQKQNLDGLPAAGSSSWQSVARATGSIETDYMNGEIVLIARLHGLHAPINKVLQREARRLVVDGREPGSMPLDELTALVDDEVAKVAV